jgi:ferredoxin
MPTVEFLNEAKKVECGQYANLRKVALLHGVEVYAGLDKKLNCRGNGLCGTCAMEIVEGADNLSPTTRRERLKLKGRPANYRLSCQCRVMGDVVCITAPALEETHAPLVAPAGS